MSSDSKPILNRYSSRITQPRSQGASQAMLYATGMTEADMNKAQVGISSVWYEGNSCNMHLNGPRRQGQGGRPGGRSWSVTAIQHHRRVRRYLHGHSPACPSLSSPATSSPTPSRPSPGRPVVRRQRVAPRLRQEHARLSSSPWAASTGLRPSWSTAVPLHARYLPAQGEPLDIVSAFPVLRPVRHRRHRRGDPLRHRPQVLPRRGCLRRHVHRQHHVLRHRGPGYVPPVLLLHPRRGSPQDGRVLHGRQGDQAPPRD